MTIESILQLIRDRTRVTQDDPMLIREINAALDWVWQRCYLTNPDLELTFGTSGTFAADTQDWDMAADVGSGTLYGVETLWIRGAADSDLDYVPVVWCDPNDANFLALAQIEPVQLIQPVLAAVYNFDQVRFANVLPLGTLWKIDWIAKPRDFSLNTNCVTSVPDPLHEAIVERACYKVWRTYDDSRSADANMDSLGLVSAGLKVIKRRQFSTKQSTKPYPCSTAYGPIQQRTR